MRLFFKTSNDSMCSSKTWEFPPLENDKQIFIPLENDISSPCPAITMESQIPSMANAPSSRHPSGPPSPKIAEEPKEISLEKPNCAAMQIPNNQPCQPVLEHKLKSALKKPVHNINSSVIPELPDVDTVKDKFMNQVDLPSKRTSKSDLLPVNGFQKKKRVTFSVNLVQGSYRNIPFRHKLPKCTDRSLMRLKSSDGTTLRSVIQMRNKVLSNKSS